MIGGDYVADLLDGIGVLNMPTIITVIIVAIYLLIDFKTKVVPELMSIKAYFEKRKQKKEEEKKDKEDQRQTLIALQNSFNELKSSVDSSLGEIRAHYSPKKLKERDEWMSWVNDRAKVYDKSVQELTQFKESLDITKELTLDLYINVNRNRIIDFANQVINENVPVSRESFERIFKIYDEYEAILEKYGKTNGEVDVSIDIIRQAYKAHTKNHTFIEDSRGIE